MPRREGRVRWWWCDVDVVAGPKGEDVRHSPHSGRMKEGRASREASLSAEKVETEKEEDEEGSSLSPSSSSSSSSRTSFQGAEDDDGDESPVRGTLQA